ncbi:MAG TPA: tetratricopeptide repeat protein [Polyangia bacterium]
MIVLLLLFVAGRCLVPMDETDVFFNLRLGELVLGSGRVTTENLLSFTHPHATDVNLAWLFQIVLALAHRAAGLPGTVLLKTAFVLASWATLFRVAVRRGADPALAAILLALAAWAAEPRFVERPHLVTFLGLAILLLAIERAEAKQPRLLWLMIPAGLVWANANSCFFLAPVVLLLYALGAWQEGLHAHARRASWVALAMVPCMFATPSGTHCLSYIANHFRMPTLRPLQEYRHAEWPLDGPFFFLAAGLLFAFVAPFAARKLPPTVFRRVLLPCVALGILGGLRIRFVAEFAMLAGTALAVACTRLLPPRCGRWQRRIAALLLVGLTVVPRVASVAEGARLFDLGLEPDLVPLAAVDFVEKNGLRERMYNDLEVGSYLTWRGWPRYRVFQDPRINGYPEAFHAVLRRPDLSRDEWQHFLDGFGVTSALVTYPSVNPRGALFDPALWALVYRAGDGLVFVRRSLRSGLPEIPLTFSYAPASGLSTRPLDLPPAGVEVSVCEWRRRVGDYHRSVADARSALRDYETALAANDSLPCSQEARVSAGILAVQLGDLAKAVELLKGSTSAVARTNHGFALLGLGQPAPALADFEGVLAGEPRNDEATFGRGMCLVSLGRSSLAATAFEALLARSPHHLSAPAAKQQLERLRGRSEER